MNKDQQPPRDLAHRLRRFEILDRITQISLASENMEDALSGTLDLVLEVFNADRAWFLYPCDPDAPSWSVPMERARPEWPGLFAQGVDMPMDSSVSGVTRQLLSTHGVIQYGPDSEHPVPPLIAEHFSVKSQVITALRPKTGKPWMFGLHHCATAVKHDEDELHLFTAIAHRISDTLSVLLSIKQLRESEARLQMQADIALQQSEHHLKEAQAIAHIGSWDYNLATGQLTWSDELYRIYGVSPDTFTPSIEALLDIILSDDRPALQAWIEACASGEKLPALEFGCMWPDGSVHYVEGKGELVLDAEGKPGHAFGTGQDITERKQSEKRLAESEAQFRGLFENMSRCVAVYAAVENGADFIIKDFNRAAELLENVKREEVTNKRVTECFPGIKEFGLFAVLQRVWKTGKPEHVPIRFYRDHRISGWRDNYVYRLPSGAVVAVYEDVTARKQAEIELRVAAVSFESQESLMITDADTVILRVNQAFTETTGYTAEEAVGQTPRLIKSDRHNAEFYRAMWESIRCTGTWQGEIWDKRKNGEVYPAWLTITAVKGGGGAVTHYVGAHLDITERKAADEAINLLAFYDPLTLLPNRRMLFDRLRLALASSARSGRKGALLFIDLDNFKTLNDTLGHDIGDLLLQQVALRLTPCVREGDTVARLGGDEFVVILEDLSEHPLEAAAQTESIGEKIITTLNQPYPLAAYELCNTPSIGAALFNGHEQGADELFKQADIAMYQAKKAGRNTLRFFDPQMQDIINERARLENELRKAIAHQQFHLYYQIQMDHLRRPLGAEALIRWAHPERGLIFPEQFIALAEETGLILPIGQWVLETACAQIKSWQQTALTRDLVLAINVSARQFHQADFVAQVHAAVRHHAISPGLLKLELTESLLLEDIEDTISTMSALKVIGIQFSLDDFGSGYSSLQYLKRLPLDQLKIDQSFISDIVKNSSDKAVVRAIIAMAQSLNLDVIAEGVEINGQRQLLLDKGCTHYQGYLFGRPVPIAQFEASLQQGLRKC